MPKVIARCSTCESQNIRRINPDGSEVWDVEAQDWVEMDNIMYHCLDCRKVNPFYSARGLFLEDEGDEVDSLANIEMQKLNREENG